MTGSPAALVPGALRSWMLGTLSTPAPEYPIFPAALAEATLLAPEEVLDALRKRAVLLAAKLERLDEATVSAARQPRVLLLENEYDRAVTDSELTRIRTLIRELDDGELLWSDEEVRGVAAQTHP